MKIFDEYLDRKAKVLKHFGYVTDWVEIPLDDCRGYYWYLDGDPAQKVVYAKTPEQLPGGSESAEDDGDYYSAPIYTQRFLNKWVYETDDYTLICMDTQCDGNKFLGVFDNEKRRKN